VISAASFVALLVVSCSGCSARRASGSPADPICHFPPRPVWYLQALFVRARPCHSTWRVGVCFWGLLLFVSVAVFLYARRRSGSDAERRLVHTSRDRRQRRLRVSDADGRRTRARRTNPIVRSYRGTRDLGGQEGRGTVAWRSGARGAALLDADPLHCARRLFAEHCANCHAIADLRPPLGGLSAPALRWIRSAPLVLGRLAGPGRKRILLW